MSRGDWKWWGWVFGLVLLLAVVLYAAAWSLPPGGSRFSGFLVNGSDSLGYQAFARLYSSGGCLIDNPYASDPRPPVFFNLFWLLVGKGMGLTGLSFIAIYYVAGVLAAGFLYLAILLVMREFLGEGPRARYAYLLAGFASGVGWLAALVLYPGMEVVKQAPVDLYLPEGFPLQAALGFPHQALSFALLAFVMLWAWRGTVTGRRRWMAAAGGLSFVLGFFHPYPLVTIAAVMVAWYLVLQVRRGWAFLPRWLDLGLLGAGILSPVLYYRWLFAANENFAGWGKENQVHTTVGAVLLGLGPLVALAAAGLWRRRRDGEVDDGTLFLATWAGVNLALIFSGRFLGFEAKLVEGLVLPLAALGAAAVFGPAGDAVASGGAPPGSKGLRFRWLPALLILALLLPSHAYRLGSALRLAAGEMANMIPSSWGWKVTVLQAELEAVDFLRRDVPPGSLVMAAPDVGVFLPAVVDVRSFVGHHHSTPAFWKKWGAFKWYHQAGGTADERRLMLQSWEVGYLWFGPLEREITGVVPEAEPYLEPVFDNGTVGIFRVRPR